MEAENNEESDGGADCEDDGSQDDNETESQDKDVNGAAAEHAALCQERIWTKKLLRELMVVMAKARNMMSTLRVRRPHVLASESLGRGISDQ